jgi:L-rhamnose isomerase
MLRSTGSPHSARPRIPATFTARLAQMEDAKSLPWGLVWQEYCARHERPSDGGWLAKVQADEKARLSARR